MALDFTVFLLDDDAAVLKAVGRLLQAAGYTTKTYCSAEAFLSEQDASTPGCLVLDLAMPGLNGLAVQEALALRDIDRPIIFLTGQGTIPESVQAMRAGAVDFLTKPVGKSELISAIKSAEDRDRTQRHIGTQRKAVLQKVAKLTRREKEVLALMVTGQQSKAIGNKLGIREKTIKVYRGRVRQKMEVRSKKSCRTGADDSPDILVIKQTNRWTVHLSRTSYEGSAQARPRRRMSAFGPKRTCGSALHTSAFDPTRTSCAPAMSWRLRLPHKSVHDEKRWHPGNGQTVRSIIFPT